MKRISFALFLTLMLLLQGCIREDLSDCESELLLRFRYTLNEQYTNLFGAEVYHITVYVFDSNGKYVDQFSEHGNKLTNEFVMHIPLPEGKYSALAYSGNFTTYSVGESGTQTRSLGGALRKGVTDINDFRLELNGSTDAENYLVPTNVPDDLHAGLTTQAASAISNKLVTDVDLIKITKKIKVTISGTDVLHAPLDVFITALNGRYKSDNSIDPNNGTFKYVPMKSATTPNKLVVDFKQMRLMLGQSPMLVIRNRTTQEVLYHENMIDLILSTGKYASQEDFDREDEFDFNISFVNDILIGVSINGWIINNITPDQS